MMRTLSKICKLIREEIVEIQQKLLQNITDLCPDLNVSPDLIQLIERKSLVEKHLKFKLNKLRRGQDFIKIQNMRNKSKLAYELLN